MAEPRHHSIGMDAWTTAHRQTGASYRYELPHNRARTWSEIAKSMIKKLLHP
jgi:hypothetical protein